MVVLVVVGVFWCCLADDEWAGSSSPPLLLIMSSVVDKRLAERELAEIRAGKVPVAPYWDWPEMVPSMVADL